jgi:O-antigen/teichoic acid export membrane protein
VADPQDTTESASSQADAAVPDGSTQSGGRHRLVKNTLYLTVAQAVTIPLAVASNALAGRYLGPEEFGYLYLAWTLCGFGSLAFEWGQQGALPALVARDRARSGHYLGTSLVWRCTASLLVAGVLAVACWLLGYQRGVLWAIALAFPVTLANSLGSAMKDTIRGFERTDIPAYAHVAQQFAILAVVAPALLLGGHMRAVLLSYLGVAIVAVLYLRHWLRPVGVGRLVFERSTLKSLFALGTPFVFFDLAMVLLPNVNATFLSKLVPAEVIGWYSVSQRLIGLLIFPASALIGALYPTLCRLQGENQAEFVKVSRSSLYGVALLAIPAALGCGLFAELGVAIFGTGQFGGAVSHLRVMSVFVFLVYFSMPLGTCIMAANRQRVWALVQCICVVVSLVGSPLLVPLFQRSMANGAIGTCITLVISEAFVVICGLALAPRGLVNRELMKSLLLASVAGMAMAGVAVLTKPISLFLAVPASLLTYGVVAWFSGAVQPSSVDMIKGFLARKLKRA